MQLSLSYLSLLLLATFTTAAPLGINLQEQQFITTNGFSKSHIDKRGMTEIFSPILAPKRGIFSAKTEPTTAPNSGTLPKSSWESLWLPNQVLSSPEPKLWTPVIEPKCTHSGPYCPLALTEGIKGSLSKPPVLSSRSNPGAVVPAAAVVRRGLTAGELGKSIVEQVDVDCPHCGYGENAGRSKWVMFVEWVKEVWQKIRGTLLCSSEPEE